MLTPPTDNLYKFLAITGTIVALLSLYVPTQILYELQAQHDATTQKLAISKIEADYFEKKVDRYVQAIEEAKKKYDRKASVPFIDYSPAEIKAMAFEIDDLQKQSRIALAESQRFIDDQLRLKDQLQFARVLSDISLIAGIILAFLGYTLWYFLVQRPMDRRLKSQSTPG